MPPHVLLSNTILNFSVKKGKNREFESFPIEVLIQEEKCEWNLNFAISLMANLLNLNSTDYNTFRNLSMIAHVIEIQKSKSANI